MSLVASFHRVVAVSLVGFTTACSVYVPRAEIRPTVELQQTFVDAGVTEPDRWWLDFSDADLTSLIEESLSENLSLRMAWSRLDQMSAIARAAGAGRYPTADLSVSGERQRFSDDLAGSMMPGQDNPLDTLTAGLTVGYQVDVWKKISNSRKAALLDKEATREDLEATALAVTGAAGELWFGIAADQASIDLLNRQLRVSQDYLDLVQLRFANGLATAVDVYQQRLQLETTRNQLPATEVRLGVQKHQMAILLGREPRSEISLPASELPNLPPLPATGVPIEVVRIRPDVRAAEMRLSAADHRLAIAIADRYPSLSFSATAGGQAEDFSNILDQWFVNLAANLLAPIFDGGRRAAEADRNRAVVEERFYAWESSVLAACAEVENALVTERGLIETRLILNTQLDLAEASLQRARALYINGLADYLTVLTALQSLQNLERQSISTQQEMLNNRIGLYLALGGSWSQTLNKPTPLQEEPS